jgi:hypothetical protein
MSIASSLHQSTMLTQAAGNKLASGIGIASLVPFMQHAMLFVCSFSSRATPPYLTEAKQKSKAEQFARQKKGKEKKKLDIPRALSAYILFVKDQAAARKGTGQGAGLLQALAQEWKALSDLQKEPYKKQVCAV